MSQSWDNVAVNMHELLSVSSYTQNSIISLAVCQPLVLQCACSSTNFESISRTLWTTPLNAAQQPLLEFTTAMVMFSPRLCLNVESTTSL